MGVLIKIVHIVYSNEITLLDNISIIAQHDSLEPICVFCDIVTSNLRCLYFLVGDYEKMFGYVNITNENSQEGSFMRAVSVYVMCSSLNKCLTSGWLYVIVNLKKPTCTSTKYDKNCNLNFNSQ